MREQLLADFMEEFGVELLLQYLWCGFVCLEEQSGSCLEEGPQLDLILPADGELCVTQGEDLVDSMVTHQVVLQFLCGQTYTYASLVRTLWSFHKS